MGQQHGVEGHQAKDGEDMQAFMNAPVARLLRRRCRFRFSRAAISTGSTQEEATVAIVNRTFAEHFFPGKSAIGKRLGFGGGPQDQAHD